MLAKQLQGAAKSAVPQYIEDIFSTYLWTGTDATQTINNGIDLSTNGGLVWMKRRDASGDHGLFDTIRGSNRLISNSTAAQAANTQISSFNTNGFTLSGGGDYNSLFGGVGQTTVGWTFRKQAKFFDVVTYTGNGTNPRTIAHNLGSTPGCIIVKETNAAANWAVWHRSLGDGYRAFLNLTNASTNVSAADWFGTSNSTITATDFTVGSNLNTNGRTYVAYLFAHDAGGFGAAGTDNVISCGSFSTNASGAATVTLGYEPQWILWKAYSGTTGTSDWDMFDNMRGYCVPGASNDRRLQPNSSGAEGAVNIGGPTATGFTVENLNATSNYIYIAIRRGPMRTPTSGTSVFTPVTRAGTQANATVTTDFVTDAAFIMGRTPAWQASKIFDRLRGATNLLYSNTTGAQVSDALTLTSFANMSGYTLGTDASNYDVNRTTNTYINWNFRRAPGFFDVVCYTGTGSATTITHNLASVPELMIVKTRSTADFWYVYHKDVGNTKYLQLQATAAPATSSVVWNNTTPTSSVFSVGVATNGSGVTHVAYLFSTVTGVSKVGSYTGNGSNQTINCGFTAGARFIMIKRTDSTGDWYVWDTARGIVSGNDPHLSLNTTSAEVTTNDTIDPDNSGFIVNQVAATNVNVSSATYIFLAIA